MNLSAIDLNLLVILDALISECHVGRAARKVGLSQPATSHALHRLRELFSDPLLVRVGSYMEPTPRATALRQSLKASLEQVRSLLIADSFEPRSSSRHFSIMMQDHFSLLITPPLAQRLQTEAPSVTLTLLPWQNPKSLNLDRLQSIDMMLCCSDGDLPGLHKEKLFPDMWVTIIRNRHPAAQRMKSLKGFRNAMHVAVLEMGLSEDPVDVWLRQEGCERQIALHVPSYIEALQVVAHSNFVAVVPKRLAQSFAKLLHLTLVPPPVDPGICDEYVFFPRRAIQDPASIWLRNLTRQIGAEL